VRQFFGWVYDCFACLLLIQITSMINRFIGSSVHHHPAKRNSGARRGPRFIGSSENLSPNIQQCPLAQSFSKQLL
jgi:hypothetical protein